MISTFEKKILVGSGLDAKALRLKLNNNRGSLLQGVGTALIKAKRDERAEAYEVVVEEVHVDEKFPNQVHLDLAISWSLYHGCKKMNQEDTEYLSEGATYTSHGELIFLLPEPRRAPSGC